MMTKNADDRAPGDAGLTLVELLVVLVVLGLISAIAVPQVMNFLGGAKTDAAKLQIDRLAGVLDVYRLDAGRYPSSDEGLQALLTQPSDVARWRGPYIDGEDALVDPWGTRFAYEVPGENGKPYSIITRGADGHPGGEGENADISN